LLSGRILLISRDFDNALISFQESRQICRSLGDAEGESMALDDIGSAYTLQRKWDEALTALNESLELKQSERRRDIIGLGITLDRVAQIHSRRGNWSAAQTACSSSLKFFQDARKGIPAARTLMNMAMIHAAQGQKPAALATLDKAVGLLRSEQSGMAVLKVALEIHSRLERRMIDGVAWMHWQYAEFKSQQLSIRRRFDGERRDEKWKEAAIGYDALAKHFIESGQQMEAGLALNELAGAYRHLGDFARSEDAIRQALAIFEEITLPLGLAASWHKLGDLFEEQSKLREAEEAYAESIKLKIESSDEDGEGISQGALALVLIKAGRFDDAGRAAIRAYEIFSEGGSAWQKWHPLIRILWLKVEQNNLPEAQAVTARLVDAVRGNRELEVAADELRAMAAAGDWDGVKARLARAGITGPAEVPAPAPAVDVSRKASSAPCSLRRRAQGWEICFNGDGPFQLRDTVGVWYLATLLGSDGEPFHCSRLASSKGRAAVSSSLTSENTPVLTSEAKRACRVKLAELKEQIATAESRGLVSEVVDLKEEAEEIGAALGAAHDKLGGDQSLADDGNRVRNAVCNPIRRVVNALRDDSQTREIGLHLIEQVNLGFNCVYPKNREKGFPWVVEQ
jgi:tetratricopeptide (TPR) repeat protein